MARLARIIASLILLLPVGLTGQVSTERLLNAAKEPQNWLTYNGSYSGQRYSTLQQVDRSNVKNLELKWMWQSQTGPMVQATPLVVDGIMYLTQPPNDIVALDAKTGRVFWVYDYTPKPDARPCCAGFVNRGVAILGDTLFMATIDAHLVAVDAKNGGPLWKVKVAESADSYVMTLAPLVIKDKVVIGVAGGDMGIRGFIAAYDARTGKEAWRFYTVPGPGEPGHETWLPAAGAPKGTANPDAWKRGGGSVWTTGSYDPALNLTYWGIGNPWPDFSGAQRPGDNLYSDSVVALDADTGQLKWYFQFTPHDVNDYDSTQVPILVDMNWSGSPAKLMVFGNRNGFLYVLDRATGKFLLGQPYIRLNWASGLDEKGRPIETPQPADVPTSPSIYGGTNWYSPSYSPRTGLFYIPAWEDTANFLDGAIRSKIPGIANPRSATRAHVNTLTDELGTGAVTALDPRTGEQKWKFKTYDVNTSGILTTASDLLFVGGREGYFHALDARTGTVLWKTSVGWHTLSAPMTYELAGKQYVAIAAGRNLMVYGLRD